ncbi:MAG: caspase family protein [Chryseolinea sp.]
MNILILDACRTNPFPSRLRTVEGGLIEMKKAKGSFIAYATAPGSTAMDGTDKNGLYTQELMKAIEVPGLSIEQVFKEVRSNVLRLSDGKQNTWDVSNITGDFYFNLQETAEEQVSIAQEK